MVKVSDFQDMARDMVYPHADAGAESVDDDDDDGKLFNVGCICRDAPKNVP